MVKKTVKSGDQIPKKQTVATKKRVTATIAWVLQKANGSLLALPGTATPGNVALDLCYLS
jgi:hypothetical protein